MEVSVNPLHPSLPLGGWQTWGSGHWGSVCACDFHSRVSKSACLLERQTCCFTYPLCEHNSGPVRDIPSSVRAFPSWFPTYGHKIQRQCVENLHHTYPLSQTPNISMIIPWKDTPFPRKKLVRSELGEWHLLSKTRYRKLRLLLLRL